MWGGGRKGRSARRGRALARHAGRALGGLAAVAGRALGRAAAVRWPRRPGCCCSWLGLAGRARRGGPAGSLASCLGRDLAHLGLAVGADLPAWVERLAAHRARLLEPPQAARAAQERLLDLEPAVLAVNVLEGRQPCLGG